MKKVRLLCLLALLFAVGSAFTTIKDGFFIYAVSDGATGYDWTDEPPESDCEDIIEVPCYYELRKGASIPAPNNLPPAGDVLNQSLTDGIHP